MADLERPTGSFTSNVGGRLKVSIEGRAELDWLDIRSEGSRELSSTFKLDIGGDGALCGRVTLCSFSVVNGSLKDRCSASDEGNR